MADFLMPKLSDSMEEGRILRWLKQPGDSVAIGDVLLEVETDKADMEVEATWAGVLLSQSVAEGSNAAVGAVLATIDAAAASASAGRTPPPTSVFGSLTPPASERGMVLPPGPHRVSPLARARAADLGLDPALLEGSGPGGRVLQRDVEAAALSGAGARRPLVEVPGPAHALAEPTRPLAAPTRPLAAPTRPLAEPTRPLAEPTQPSTNMTPAEAPTPPGNKGGVVRVARPLADAALPSEPIATLAGSERVPLSPMRASIARRMVQSKREAPHFYAEVTADLGELLRLREALRRSAGAGAGAGAGVTLNHFILRAVAGALREQPALNSRFAGEAIEIAHEINIGIATAVTEGLVLPVLRHADTLDLFEIAERAQDLARRARERKLRSEELSGATFSVSNLGMYGVERFAAIINPPQAAILAIGAALEKPAVREGRIEISKLAVLTVSCDHRAVDGAQAGQFLAALRSRLEEPVGLLLPVPRESAGIAPLGTEPSGG